MVCLRRFGSLRRKIVVYVLMQMAALGTILATNLAAIPIVRELKGENARYKMEQNVPMCGVPLLSP